MEDETRLSIDAIVESYLDARKNRESLTIADVLHRCGTHERGCLESLVLADAKLRIAEDGHVSAEDYLRQWPELAGSDCLEQVRRLSSGMVKTKRGVRDYQAGERVSQFEIIRSIGTGTHGCVYLAKDLTLRRIVALKVSAASGVEGEALARLDHPNVVRVFGEQTVGEHKFLAMQFIAGRTLAEFLGEKPYQCPSNWSCQHVCRWIDDQTPSDEGAELENGATDETVTRVDRYDSLVVRWTAQLATALHHAHLRGVLHRDVKPGNVILDRRARPMLADFNVARLEAHLETGEFGGTLPYMAPEHLRAYQAISGRSSDQVDVRSDLYSLGIMLLELLSGHKTWGELPAEGERFVPALLAQRLGGIPDSFLRGIRPRSLRCVLNKCLAADPDRRYQSAGDLASDLQAWLDGRPLIHADGHHALKSVTRIAYRYPRSLAVAGMMAIICAGGFIAAQAASRARIDSYNVKIEEAKDAMISGDLTTASTLIGETRGMMRDPPVLGRIDNSSRGKISLQLQRLESEVRKTQFNVRADVVRLTFASAIPGSTIDASKALLDIYGVLRYVDWDSRPPFASLDDSSQEIVAEGVTEMILIMLLQMKQSGDPAAQGELVRRIPRRHRRMSVFERLLDDQPQANRATEADRDSFAAHLNGMIAFHEERFDDAHRWFDRSISWRDATKASRFWTHFWQARSCEELDRIWQAIALYGTCIGQRPGFTWPRYNLARLLAKDGQLEPAMRYVDSVIRVEEQFAPAYVLRSAILVKQGKHRDAIDACQHALRFAEASVDLYKNRAAAHAGLNEFEQAYEDLSQAYRMAPNDQPLKADLDRIKGMLESFGRR